MAVVVRRPMVLSLLDRNKEAAERTAQRAGGVLAGQPRRVGCCCFFFLLASYSSDGAVVGGTAAEGVYMNPTKCSSVS